MLRTRGTRFALSVLALTAGATLAASTIAVAEPAPKPQAADVPLVPEGVPVDAIASLAPAIVGAAAQAGNIASPGAQTILDQPVWKMARTIIFPKSRPVQAATLRRAGLDIPLTTRQLVDGRTSVRYESNRPEASHAHTIHWRW